MGLLELLKSLFGKGYLNKIMGTRTNVAKPIRMDTDSPFKAYSDDAFNDPKALAYIEKKIDEYGPYALSNKNPQELANFEANAKRLLAAKNRQAGTTPEDSERRLKGMAESMKPKPEAEIIDIGTGKKIDDEGIMTLKERAPQINTKASANLKEDIAKLTEREARAYSANIESFRRPIIRQILLKDTKIKLPDDVRKSLENKMDLSKGADPKMDPLRLLNEYYDVNFSKLDELEEIRFTARNESEAADEFLQKGGLEPKKDLGDKLKDYDGDPDGLADGGRPGFKFGSGKNFLKYLQSKVGKKNITTADKIKQPQSALDRKMFEDFNQRNTTLTKSELEDFENEIGDALEAYDFDGTAGDAKRILKEQKDYMGKMSAEYKAEGGAKRAGGPKDPIKNAMDEVGGNFTGDLKYDADVLADEIAFQRGLIPEGGDITDIADQKKRMDIYDEAYSAVSGVFKKQREMKKTKQFYDERESTSVWTEEYQNNLDNQVMKELDYSKKEFNELSEEWKEKFRKQIDGNYADAMEDTAGIVIKDPRPDIKLSYADKDKRMIPEGLNEEDIDFAILKGEFERKYSKLIDDNLMRTIMADDDIQRVKEVIAEVEQAAIMRDKGMGSEEIVNTLLDASNRKKNADGGLNYLMGL